MIPAYPEWPSSSPTDTTTAPREVLSDGYTLGELAACEGVKDSYECQLAMLAERPSVGNGIDDPVARVFDVPGGDTPVIDQETATPVEFALLRVGDVRAASASDPRLFTTPRLDGAAFPFVPTVNGRSNVSGGGGAPTVGVDDDPTGEEPDSPPAEAPDSPTDGPITTPTDDSPGDTPTDDGPGDGPTTGGPTTTPPNQPTDGPNDDPVDNTPEDPTDTPTDGPVDDDPVTDIPTDDPDTDIPTDGPPTFPNDPTDDGDPTTPIPAPPALGLAALGGTLVWLSRRRSRRDGR